MLYFVIIALVNLMCCMMLKQRTIFATAGIIGIIATYIIAGVSMYLGYVDIFTGSVYSIADYLLIFMICIIGGPILLLILLVFGGLLKAICGAKDWKTDMIDDMWTTVSTIFFLIIYCNPIIASILAYVIYPIVGETGIAMFLGTISSTVICCGIYKGYNAIFEN